MALMKGDMQMNGQPLANTGAQMHGYQITLDGASSANIKRVGSFNTHNGTWPASYLPQGAANYATIVHELGHAFGLGHPYDDGQGSQVMQGVTGPEGSYGAFNINQGINTVMSYNGGWLKKFGDLTGLEYGREGTLMAFDIAVQQAHYGANTTAAVGNDTYTLATGNKVGTFWSSIWDTGGADTIVAGGNGDAVIGLRAATLDHSATGSGAPS